MNVQLFIALVLLVLLLVNIKIEWGTSYDNRIWHADKIPVPTCTIM
jgi:hypothetical protein